MRKLVIPQTAQSGSRYNNGSRQLTAGRAGSGHRRWRAAGAAALLAAALVIVLSACGNSPQAVTGRQYSASQACLLTDSGGIATPPAAAVWAGMEDASQATRAKVAYLAVNGSATTGRAILYANSLIERHCNPILAVGASETSAISEIAARTPGTSFVIVSSRTDFSTANLKTVSLSAETRSQVKQEVESLANN